MLLIPLGLRKFSNLPKNIQLLQMEVKPVSLTPVDPSLLCYPAFQVFIVIPILFPNALRDSKEWGVVTIVQGHYL